MGLGTVQPPLAEKPARTERDGGLDRMVARTQRILRRVEQGQHALALVIVQHRPQKRQTGTAEQSEPEQDFPGQPGQEQHVESSGAHQQRGAQIGLSCDKQHRHDHEHRTDDEVAHLQDRFVAIEIPGKQQRDCNFHELGGLNAREAEIEPAARTVDHFSGERHADQQGQADYVQGQRDARKIVQRNICRDPHDAQCNTDIDDLADHPFKAFSRSTEQGDQPHYQQGRYQPHQVTIDMLDQISHQPVNHFPAPHPVAQRSASAAAVPCLADNSPAPDARSARRCCRRDRRFRPGSPARSWDHRPAHRQ